MIQIKKESRFVSFNYVSFLITVLESRTSDKSHFSTQTPQITNKNKLNIHLFEELYLASSILTINVNIRGTTLTLQKQREIL